MKKDTKEKKGRKRGPDKMIGALTPVLEPLPSPLCRLPPLRRLNSSGSGNSPALLGSLSSSRGLQPFRPTTGETDISISKTFSTEDERTRLLREKDERVRLLQEELRRGEEETKKLKEESEAMREKVRITLERAQSAERDRLNAQKKQDTERLEAELKEQLEAERTRLQGENKEKLNALKEKESELQGRADQLEQRAKALKSEEDTLHTKIADLNTRKIKVGEEEKEVDRQIELIQERDQLKEELEQAHEVIHRAMEEWREAKEKKKQLMEEQDQLREELTRMREEKCQACEFIQRAREERSEAKEEKEQLREERDQLTEELQKMREGRDQVREELERMREEKHQVQELMQRVREDMSKAREEGEKRLRGEMHKARDESRKAKEDKGKLESRVTLLQETCDRLRHRVSELEQGEGSPPKEEMVPSSDRNDELLHLDDLAPRSPGSNIQSNMDRLPCYISPLPTSTHKPNVCVKSESSQLKERQAAPRATQSSITLDSSMVTEEMIRDLLQEVRKLSKLEKRVWGVKEDQIQQLKSVKTQEPLSGEAGERRATDDVPELDHSCTVDPLVRAGGRPSARAKVLESLQQISNHFNTVLSTLGSVAGFTPYTAVPLSASQPHSISSFNPVMHQTHGLCPDSLHPPVSARQVSFACDNLINRQWSQTFPGAAMNPVTSHRMMSTSAYSSYTPFSKHGNRLCSVEMDGPSLQRQIDSMKMWLESRRKDTSVPLLSRYLVKSSEKDLT